MKRRLCTKEEKKIIQKHWKNICTGFATKSAHPKIGDIFLGIFVWGVFWLGAILSFGAYVNRWVIMLLGIVIAIFSVRLVNFLLLTIRVRKIKRRFLRKEKLLVNGATVVKVKDEYLKYTYAYVEDGEYLEEKVPYGITVEALKCDVGEIKKGERLLLIYGTDNHNELAENISLQMMKMPQELEDRFPLDEVWEEEIKQNEDKIIFLPHPNAAKIQKERRTLTKEEKSEIENRMIKREKVSLRLLMLVFTIFLGAWINGAVLLLDRFHFLNLLPNKWGIYVLINIVFIIIVLALWRKLEKRVLLRLTKVTYVQEILLKSIDIENKGKAFFSTPVFYEWDGVKFKEFQCPYVVSGHAEYGTVFRKYINENDSVFLIEKK